MKKKSFLAVLSVLALSIGLGSCGKTSSVASSSEAPSSVAASSETPSSETPSSVEASSEESLPTTITVSNKEEIQAEWHTKDDNRQVKLSGNIDFNTTKLINEGKIKIVSSKTAVVSVNGTYLTPVAAGKTTITVTCGTATDSFDLTITDKVVLIPTDNVIAVGAKSAFEMTSTGSVTDTAKFTWSSSDETIATVAADGTVTGVAVGEATITAKLTGNEDTYSTYKMTIATAADTYTAVKDVIKNKTAYIVKGYVASSTAAGFMLDDGTSSVYVYLGSQTAYANGDYVKISGKSSVYNNEMEFTKAATICQLIAPEGGKMMDAVELTTDMATTISKATIGTSVDRTNFVKYKYRAFAGLFGSYDCLNLVGSDVVIEPSKYSGKIVTGTYYDVEMYIIGFNTGYSYLDVMITSLKAVDVSTLTTPVAALTDSSVSMAVGKTTTLSVYTAAPETTDATVTWASTDPTIATVTEKGVVTGVAIGSTTVTATVFGQKLTATVKITKDLSSYKNTATLDYTNTTTTTEFTCTGITITEKYKEFNLPKSVNASVATNLTDAKIGAVKIDVYGKYDNLKVYAGTDATGTLLTHGDAESGSGYLYTYYCDDVASVFITNPTSNGVSLYSIEVLYK